MENNGEELVDLRANVAEGNPGGVASKLAEKRGESMSKVGESLTTMELAGDCLADTGGSVPSRAFNDTSWRTGEGTGGGCLIGTTGPACRLVAPDGAPEVGSWASGFRNGASQGTEPKS